MTTTDEQHPRSRVLLLLQALEGLHGFETSEQRAKNEEAYSKKRDAALARVNGLVEPADLKFLEKNLLRRPSSGLLDALSAVFRSLPIDIRPKLEATDLVSQLRSSDTELEKAPVERVLVRVRNDLSHGSASFEAWDLRVVADLLERVARAETLRVIGAPAPSLERALEKD